MALILLGHDERLRLKKAVVLLAFLVMVLMCVFQERLSQIVMPRYFAVLVMYKLNKFL